MASNRFATISLIVVLTLGVSSLFFVTSSFLLASLFEFLGVATVLLGWFVVAPLYLYLTRNDGAIGRDRSGFERAGLEGARRETAESETGPGGPMDVLKRRYAAGKITEAEFERKLERLLAVEDLDEVLGGDRPFERRETDDDRGRDLDGRERDLEFE